jgi:pre-mRNA-splicing factor 38A
MYIRMTFRPIDVYEMLEPLLKDYRKLRNRDMGRFSMFSAFHLNLYNAAGYSLTFIDEFVDALLREERVCDIILPRIAKRQILEENGELGPRKSRLLNALEGRSDHGSDRSRSKSGSRSRLGSRSQSGSQSPRHSESRGRSMSRSSRTSSDEGSRFVSRSPSRSQSPFRSRSRSISPDQMDTEA